jgi:hypothetical protein
MRYIIKSVFVLFIIFLLGINLYEWGKDIVVSTEENVVRPAAATTTGAVQKALASVRKLEEKVRPPNRLNTRNDYMNSISGGYCYVGTDRDVRTCIYTGAGDTCEGAIYPTMAVCRNPELRP